MTLISGAFGVVGGRSTISNWSINLPMMKDARSFSNTRGGMIRRRGPRDWNGQFAAGGTFPAVFPGDRFEGKFFVGPEEAYVPGAEGPVYTGESIIDQVVININWETGAIQSYTASFSGSGALTEEQGTYEDLSFPDAPSSSEARLVIVGEDGSESAGSDGETEVCDITTLTLTIKAANTQARNSCSGDWTIRRAGNVDWTLAMTIQEGKLSGLPFEQGDFKHFRLYIDADRYWDLKFGLVGDYGNIVVDRESAAIVSVQVTVEMSTHTEDPADGIGYIRVPGFPDVDWWPKGEVGLELVSNGDFAEEGLNWLDQAIFDLPTFNEGEAIFAATNRMNQLVWLEASKTYKVNLTASAVSAASISISLLDPDNVSHPSVCTLSAPGSDDGDFTPAVTGWHGLYVIAAGSATGTVTGVSVKPYN